MAKQAVLQSAGQSIEITTDDVSIGGISFFSEMGLAKGQIVEVNFGDGGQNVKAEVMWCSTKQVYGLKFIDASDDVKEKIQSWTAGLVPTA